MVVRGDTLPIAQPEKCKAFCDCTTLPQRDERLVDYSQDRGTYSFLEVICLLSSAVTKVARETGSKFVLQGSLTMQFHTTPTQSTCVRNLKMTIICDFHVSHKAICFPPKKLYKHCFQFSLGSNNRPLRIWKQNLSKIL